MKIQDKSKDKKYFTIIPNYIANHSSANDQALYFQMKKIVGDNEGICYASEKYFKDKLKIGSKGLKKSIQYLKEHHWIEEAGVKKVQTDGGKQEVRTYIVKDIWEMNMKYYQDKGVSESDPLTSEGVFESNSRGVQKEAKGVASEQQRRTTNNNYKKNISEDESSQDKTTNTKDKDYDLNSVIGLFKNANPMYTEFFGLVTERKALEAVIKAIGLEETKKVIEDLEITNVIPYAPIITKPTELKRNLAKLQSFIGKEENMAKYQNLQEGIKQQAKNNNRGRGYV